MDDPAEHGTPRKRRVIPGSSCSRHPGHRPGIQDAVVTLKPVRLGKIINKDRLPTTWS